MTDEERLSVSINDNVIMIRLRRMIWAEHVARMREKRNAYRILV
jgi:hypothetical protein